MIVELHVYDRTNTTHEAVLENASQVKYLAELNGVGAGSFLFPAQDDKAQYVAVDHVVRVRIDNEDVGAFMLETVEEALVGEDIEGVGEGMIRASGRGMLALWEQAIVWASDLSNYATVETTYIAKSFAYILADQRSAAVARGVSLPSLSFTAAHDTGGTAFTDANTMTVRAGMTLLEMIRTHGELGLEVTTDADGTLNYYVSTGVTRALSFRQGKNVLKARRTGSVQNLRNAILGEGQYVLTERTDSASITAHGRRERLLKFGNTYDSSMLDTYMSQTLANLSDEELSIELVVDDSATPFVDYALGDTVTVVIPGRIDASYRIRAIALSQRENTWEVTLGLNDLYDEYLQRVDKALRRALLSPLESIESGSTDPNAGGWKISRTELTGSATVLGSAGYLRLGTGNDIVELNATDGTYRIWAGAASAASAPFSVTKAGKLYATGADISGKITADDGSIGGWTINNVYLAKDTGVAESSAGLAPLDYPFYAGETYANRASAPFRVTPAGKLYATGADISGSISATWLFAASGSVGGFTLSSGSLTAGTLKLDSANKRIYFNSSAWLDTDGSVDVIRAMGTFYAYNDMVVRQGLLVDNGLTVVSGTTELDGAVDINDDVTIDGDLTMNGNITIKSSNWLKADTLYANTFDEYTAGAGFIFGGNIDLNGNDISGVDDITLNDLLYAGRLTVSGATNLSETTINGYLDVSSEVTVGGDFYHYGSNIGFFSATKTGKKTVTGSRGGNAALASLLTALEAYGLITDSSS